jgi:hypothetical protein
VFSRSVMPSLSIMRAVVAQGLVELFLARHALGQVELAADLGRASNSVTWWPRCAATTAKASPAGPAPTTAMRLRGGPGR